MEDMIDVLAFHEKFGLPREKVLALMTEEAFKFRLGFLHEEREEFSEAWQAGNLVKTVDALLDFVYVACGTALFMGYKVDEWPRQRNVQHAAQMGDMAPADGAPMLLDKGLQVFFVYALENRVGGFANAYSAAIRGEPGAMHLAVHALKLCCIDAYLAASMMNIPWRQCWRHVQEANMAKQRAAVDGSDSVRHSPWDVIKPKGWKAPDAKIAMELQIAGWVVPEMMLVDNATGKVEMPIRGSDTSYAGLTRKG